MSVFIIEHLYKTFKVNKKNIPVLKDINLIFPDAGLVSIVGKSGSGKSTLLSLLAGIEKPTKGKIYFNGENIANYNDKKFSDYHLTGVSIIFQHYNLFDNCSALENAILPAIMNGFPRKETTTKAKEYFNKLGISDLAKRNTKNLSGGEKQRVAIIRSLLVNTKVLLCDEPTGALDQTNSIQIMEILKEISKNRLVVFVSHNTELVDKYSDEIITLSDGRLESKNKVLKDRFAIEKYNEFYDYKTGWEKRFILNNLLSNFKKNFISIISCIFCFTAIFISVGFSTGSKVSQKQALEKNLSLCFSTVSKTEFFEVEDSPLNYQKTTRPTFELIDQCFDDFSSIRIEENLSYFISTFSSCYSEGNIITNYDMIPLLDDGLINFGSELLIEGRGIQNGFSEILINTSFSGLLGSQTPLNQDIIISSSAPVTYSTGDENTPFVKDSFNYTMKFRIVGIVKEFAFLNTPKIFYSYSGAKQLLKNERMENLSAYFSKPISYLNYLENCAPDDAVCSYSYFMFLNGKSECDLFVEKVNELKNKNHPLQVSSTAIEIETTYLTFIDSFSSALLVFVLIAFIGINFILGMISLSSFIERKKETAILTTLGARNNSIFDIFLSENFIVVFISFFISLFLSIKLEPLINKLIEKEYSLSNLISVPLREFFGISYGLVIGILLISLLCSAIFTLLPMIIYRRKLLSEELRDE